MGIAWPGPASGASQSANATHRASECDSGPLLLVVSAIASIVAVVVYVRTLAPSVAIADGYELQVVSASLGVAHPTGYPLYTLVGKAFTLLPFGDVAYRVNLFSAVSAALAVGFVAATVYSATRRVHASLIAAWVLAFSVTLWRQAVIAEKYALNAAFFAALIFLMHRRLRTDSPKRLSIAALAFVYGLSLTHHRTILLLGPSIALVALVSSWRPIRAWAAGNGRRATVLGGVRTGLIAIGAFVAPLALYAYLPLRQPMSWESFVRLVTGSEYRDALRWQSLLTEPDRLDVLGRLAQSQVAEPVFWVVVGLAALGLIWLLRAQTTFGVATLLAAAAVAGFAASYYADYNDANYLLPCYVIASVWIGAGCAAVVRAVRAIAAMLPRHPPNLAAPRRIPVASANGRVDLQHRNRPEQSSPAARWLGHGFAAVLLVVPAAQLVSHYAAADASDFSQHVHWAASALDHAPPDATILAHGERFAALAYLAHTRGLRPDLDVRTFPSEADYLRRIDEDLAAGRPVYTARRIFGGRYFFESAGSLTRILPAPPASEPVESAIARWDKLALVDASASFSQSRQEVVADLTWRADEPLGQNLRFRMRLVDPEGKTWAVEVDGVPVDGNLPTPIWPPGSEIRDRHVIAVPPGLPPGSYQIEVGVHLDFHNDTVPTDDGLLTVPIGEVQIDHITPPRPWSSEWARFGEQLTLVGYDIGEYVEAGGTVPVRLYWHPDARPMPDAQSVVRLVDENGVTIGESRNPGIEALLSTVPAERLGLSSVLFRVFAAPPTAVLDEHQIQVSESATGRVRFEVAIDTPRGALPVQSNLFGATTSAFATSWRDVSSAHPQRDDSITLPTNFGDRMLLLGATVEPEPVHPGDYLHVLLDWKALAPAEEDYVISVQLTADRPEMWFQEDRAPAQGAYPVTWWHPGEEVVDRHRLAIPWELPPGTYRLQVNVYRPSDLRRLPVLDQHRRVIGDIVVAGTVEVAPR